MSDSKEITPLLGKKEEHLKKVFAQNAKPNRITITLIVINIIVFVLMIAGGVNFFKPTSEDIYNWGGNAAFVTTNGEAWRLFTCMFVHIGIVHLLFNMYALFMVGIILEPIVGKIIFIFSYICAGVMSSLVSMWWHSDQLIISAGASGAIFGLYGLFLSILTTQKIPSQVRNNLLKSIGLFVAFNLIYGLKAGVDNAAHIGGLVSGFAIGYIIFFTKRREWEESNKKATTTIVIMVALTTIASIAFLKASKTAETKEQAFQVNEFLSKLEHFQILEEMALDAMYISTGKGSIEKNMKGLTTTSLPNWVDCVNLMDESEKLHISEAQNKLRISLKEYASLRILETQFLIKEANEPNTNTTNKSIDSIQQLINKKIEAIKSTEQPVLEEKFAEKSF